MERNPDLLGGKLIEAFYSPGVLFSDPSRVLWTAPGLRRLSTLT